MIASCNNKKQKNKKTEKDKSRGEGKPNHRAGYTRGINRMKNNRGRLKKQALSWEGLGGWGWGEGRVGGGGRGFARVVLLRSCPSLLLFDTAFSAQWLRRPPRERKIRGSNSACDGIFSGSSHTCDLKLALQWLPCHGVSAGTGWPGASILSRGEVESWICDLYLNVAARKNCLSGSVPEIH